MTGNNKQGVIIARKWAQATAAIAVALVLAACGGSDPLDAVDDGGSGGGDMNTNIDLRAAYDRINKCGLTLAEASELVGERPGFTTVYWEWFEDFFNDKDELKINFTGGLEGYPDDGLSRATSVSFSNSSEGFSISKDLCD